MSIIIKQINSLSTLQNYGIFGKTHLGITHSGAADERAYLWGNYLLNNKFNSTSLEIALGFVEIFFTQESFISITGADFNFKLGNKKLNTYCVYKVNKNDVLSCMGAKFGNYAYLNIAGGFNGEINKTLKKGDIVNINYANNTNFKTMLMRFLPNYNKEKITLRVLPTYQFDEFSASEQKLFLSQTYTISKDYNKVAYRLKGKKIKHHIPEIKSEGMSIGAVEIAGDGLPIIMLKNTPTIGGYPKIATIFSLDLAKLSQYKTNTLINFKLIDLIEAEKLRKEFNNFFNFTKPFYKS